MGTSQSHARSNGPRPPGQGSASPSAGVSSSSPAHEQSPSQQMDVDAPPQSAPQSATSASTSPPHSRRRQRAPSSPRLSSFGSTLARLPSFAHPRSGHPPAEPSSSSVDGTNAQVDGRPKDKKRRRISQMLGLGPKPPPSSTTTETTSDHAPPAGLGLIDPGPATTQLDNEHPTLGPEVDMIDSSPRHPSEPPIVAVPLRADEVPLPPSRPASVPPLSPASDVLFPTQLESISPATSPQDEQVDPLWSPRLRAQSLISQLTQEIAEGGVAPSVAAYIGGPSPTDASASTSTRRESQTEHTPPIAGLSSDPAPPTAPPAAGERPSLRGRLMSSLLGRPASTSSTPSTSETAGSTPSLPSDPSTPSASRPASERGPIPTGTSLIVQGLVQTSAPTPASSRPSSSPAAGTPSSGSPSATPSFDEQAILLGGLLSVATAATASSLLSPPSTTSESASPVPRVANSTIDSIRQRIARIRARNADQAPASAQGGIENILRSYMQNSLGGAAPTTATISLAAGAAASTEAAEPPEEGSFEAFLADLQTDLVRALREFNGLPPVSEPSPTTAGAATEEGTPLAAVSEPAAPSTTEAEEAVPTPVASEEQQARAAAVGGGGQGLGVAPRRLNWTRVYRFPPRDVQSTLAADGRSSTDSVDDGSTLAPSDGASTSESTASADPQATTSASAETPPIPARARPSQVTPMIMVGVRSIARVDAADVFGAASPRPEPMRPRRASAPTSPPETGPSSALPSTSPTTEPANPLDRDGDIAMDDSASTAGDPTATSTPGQRLRQAMRAIRGRRAGQTDGEQASVGGGAGTRSFVLWVVGGLYSSDHPILAAPGLLGGQLDHDDLWALAELMGQAKPPTATTADIANSGLEIIKGATVKACCAEGKVLENSSDRCMICLSDYEDDEDCRILGCKHVFHQECVDHWMTSGRNACPACRAKAVEVPETASTSTSAPTAPTTESANVPSTPLA